MCCVNHTVWLGSAEGLLCVFDATSRQQLLQRLLAVLPNQGVTGIIHLHDLRLVPPSLPPSTPPPSLPPSTPPPPPPSFSV